MQTQLPKGYLFIHNISKKNNIGSIIRTACAFNITKIFYISNRPQTSKKLKIFKQFHCFGNQGTHNKIQYQSFKNIHEAKTYFKNNNISVCGVQIGQNSKPIHNHPFIGDTVFMMGNQGSGILPVHKQICDYFVYIPQYTSKTASLNVGVACGIILHHFAVWAKFKQMAIYGEKYQNQSQPIGQPKNKNQLSLGKQEMISEDGGKNKLINQQQLAKQFEQLPFNDQQQNK